MKQDLLIYFDAKSIETLIGTVSNAPDISDPLPENIPVVKTLDFLSVFRFKKSKGRPIRLSEQTVYASRRLFDNKYHDCREFSEWAVLVAAGDNARKEYKLHEAEIFYKYALEIAERFLPSDVIAQSLLLVYWLHYLYAWCKPDEFNIDRTIISSEKLIRFLKTLSADHLKNESNRGLYFYIDPRIELLSYLDQHSVETTDNEQQDLEILRTVLNKCTNQNPKQSLSRATQNLSNTNCRSCLKKPESVLSYKCKMYLPKDMEDKSFIPEPCYAPRNDMEIESLSKADPDGILYDMVKDHCYPDPPNYHIARFKDWFKTVNPGLFQEGAIKETIKEKLSDFIQDRKHIIKSYCKQNRLDPSLFPPPSLISIIKPKFKHVGPEHTRVDKICRRLRRIDFPVAFFTRYLIVMALLGQLLIANILLGTTLWQQCASILTAMLALVIVEIPIRYFNYRSALNKARVEPIIRPAEGSLNILLRDLKDWAALTGPEYISSILHMPELRFMKTTIRRSRPHLDKKAYLINIVSEVVLTSKVFSKYIHPEKLKLNIEIAGKSVNGPHIFVFWFDSPKSIMLAKQSVQIINFMQDQIYRLLLCRLDSHEKLVTLPANKKSPFYLDDEKIFVQYWPVYFPRWTDGKKEDILNKYT